MSDDKPKMIEFWHQYPFYVINTRTDQVVAGFSYLPDARRFAHTMSKQGKYEVCDERGQPIKGD